MQIRFIGERLGQAREESANITLALAQDMQTAESAQTKRYQLLGLQMQLDAPGCSLIAPCFLRRLSEAC